MREREEYTPTTDEVREAYAEYVDSADFPTERAFEEHLASGGGGGEFDRAIAAHDAELREQIARDIEARREHFIAETRLALGGLPAWTDAYLNGLDDAIDVARGEEDTDE